VDPEHLSTTLEQYAAEFRRLPPLAVGKAKMLINRSMENSLADHLALESETAAWSAGSQDFAEGVAAFVEKRKAVFTGR
jgi:2-(1,2-epoxy-1,2-dihydrophenyl)acetyl-CoA isomerase